MTSNSKTGRMRRPATLVLVCLLTATVSWVGGRAWQKERARESDVPSIEAYDDEAAPIVTPVDRPEMVGITPIRFDERGRVAQPRALRVVVVDPAGSPVPNVNVTVSSDSRDPLPWNSLAGPSDCLTTPIEGVLATLVSDARGLVTPPPLARGTLRLRAEYGDLGGEIVVTEKDRAGEAGVEWASEPAPWVLSLAQRRSLRVRVVDEADRAIADAIPVIVDAEAEFVAPEFFSGSFHMSHFRSSVTDREGVARFDLLDHGRRSAFHARKLWIFVLRFGGPHFVTERTWTDEPEFSVRVPELAAVTLRPVEASEQSVTFPVVASLAHGSPPSDFGKSFELGMVESTKEELASTYLSAWRLVLPPGGARVAAFHRGGTLGYLLSAEGRSDATGIVDVLAQEGGVSKLAVGPALATIVFRLRDSAGRPAHLDAYEVDWLTTTSRVSRTETDGLYVASVTPNESGELPVRDRNRPRQDGGANEALLTVRWPALAPGVEHDLGTLTIPEVERLVAGKLVDSTGNPLPRTGYTVVEFPAGSPTGDWIHGVTDDVGNFEVYRPVLANASYSVAVALTSTTMSSDEVRFVPGASDVTVTAYRSGGLAGRLVASPDVADSLVVELHGTNVAMQRTVTLRSSLHFEEVGLRPGVYELVVLLGREEVRRVPAIEILAAEQARPLALQSLVVAESHAGASVTVLDAEGNPVRWALIRVGYDGEFQGVGRFARTDGRGEAHVVLRQGPRKSLRVDLSLTRLAARFASDAPIVLEDPVFPLTVRLPR